MTQPNANSSSSNSFTTPVSRDRCRHHSLSGRRCRIPSAGSSGLCVKHQQDQSAKIAAILTANLTYFTSGAEINDFLSRLLLLLAQDKIPTRRAAVLTYIASQLLRTLPAIQKENAGPAQIIFDAPRPERDWPEEPLAPTAFSSPSPDQEHVPA
jgi:hypothetical protein